MNKRCIHVQCYRPHFKFTINLIKSFFINAKDINKYDFIIVVNDKKEEKDLRKKIQRVPHINKNLLFIKNIKDIINSPFNYLKHNENFKSCDLSIKGNKNLFDGDYWGTASSYNRKWMNIKRAYGILEIERLGYEYVWCLDAESYPLEEFSISEIFDQVIDYAEDSPLLLISVRTLTWFTQTELEKLFSLIRQSKKHIVIAFSEQNEMDLNKEFKSFIRSDIFFHSHNYPFLLKKAGLKIFKNTIKFNNKIVNDHQITIFASNK